MFGNIPAYRNEVLRISLGYALKVADPILSVALRRRRRTFSRDQEKLRQRYAIRPETPIQPWSDTLQRDIEMANRGKTGLRYALTSGSTAKPKRIPFTKQRLRMIKRSSFETMAQTVARLDVSSPVLFVLSGIDSDDSLSGLLLEPDKSPGILDGLIMPSKFVNHPALRRLRDEYGVHALRIWLIVLSNPTILYATNPSTISTFLRALSEDWGTVNRLVHMTAAPSWEPNPAVRKVIGLVAGQGWQDRLRQVASIEESPALVEIAPRLSCYCCWDGGYVTPFLDDIRQSSLASGLRHVPMYSMSTECIQTQTVFEGDAPHYLPMAPGVLYEFLPEDETISPKRLIAPEQVQPGQSVTMVVSDQYGLRRYLTQDVFLCRFLFDGLPDLRFLRRQGLAYSFTGEKLTGPQVEAAIGALMTMEPSLSAAGVQMILIPALGASSAAQTLPHYRLLIAHAATVAPTLNTKELSATFDVVLSGQNSEFATKLESKRLGPTETVLLDYDSVARRMTPPERHQNRGWETQFKLSPLSTRRWDEMALPELKRS